MYGGKKRCIQRLVGKPVGTRRLGRSKRRWEDHTEMDLTEVGWGGGHGLDQSGSG
jgi:hypothetical protein